MALSEEQIIIEQYFAKIQRLLLNGKLIEDFTICIWENPNGILIMEINIDKE